MTIKNNFFCWILLLSITFSELPCFAMEQKPLSQKLSKEALKNFFKQLSVRVQSCPRRPIVLMSSFFFLSSCLLSAYAYDMKKNYHAELDAYSELFLKTELCKTCIKTSQQLPDHYSVRIDTQSKEIFYLDNNNKHVQIWSEKSGILPIKDLLLEKFFRQHINENSDKLIPEEATLNIMPTVDAQPKEYRLTLVWNDGKKECTEQLETKISQEEIDDLMIQF